MSDRSEAAYIVATGLALAGVPQADAEHLIGHVAKYGGPTELAELAAKVTEAYQASTAPTTLREEFARRLGPIESRS